MPRSAKDFDSELKCPICLEIIIKTTLVSSVNCWISLKSQCLHRFCYECINTALRLGYFYSFKVTRAKKKRMSIVSKYLFF